MGTREAEESERGGGGCVQETRPGAAGCDGGRGMTQRRRQPPDPDRVPRGPADAVRVARGDARQTSVVRNGDRVRARRSDRRLRFVTGPRAAGWRPARGRTWPRVWSLRLGLEDRRAHVEPSSRPSPPLVAPSGDPTARPTSRGTEVAPPAPERAAPANGPMAPEPGPAGAAAPRSLTVRHRDDAHPPFSASEADARP